jgi:hypothetical protein
LLSSKTPFISEASNSISFRILNKSSLLGSQNPPAKKEAPGLILKK